MGRFCAVWEWEMLAMTWLQKIRQKFTQGLIGKSSVGIAICDRSVSMVVLEKYQGREHLILADSRPLDENLVTSGQIHDTQAVGRAILDMIHTHNLSVTTANLCVMGDAVITSQVVLDGCLSEQEIEAQILVDAEKYISQPLEQVYFDFTVLSQNDQTTTILLAFAHIQAVEACIESLAVANVDKIQVQIHAHAIEQVYGGIMNHGVQAVLDIDWHQLRLYVFENGQLLDQQTEFFGLADCQNTTDGSRQDQVLEIQDADLDFYAFIQDQEKPKTSQAQVLNTITLKDSSDQESQPPLQSFDGDNQDLAGPAKTDKARDFIISFDDVNEVSGDLWSDSKQLTDLHHGHGSPAQDFDYSSLAFKIDQILKIYHLAWDRRIDFLYLTGLDQGSASFAQFLANNLNLPVKNMPVFAKITKIDDKDWQYDANFATACGLALRDLDEQAPKINLAPWRDEMRFVRQRQASLSLWLAAAFACMVLLVVYGIIWQKTVRQEAINREILARIEQKDNQLSYLNKTQAAFNQSQAQVTALEDLVRANQALLARWQLLANSVPNGVYLTALEQVGEKLILKGETKKQRTGDGHGWTFRNIWHLYRCHGHSPTKTAGLGPVCL